jgi:hypothetical protein
MFLPTPLLREGVPMNPRHQTKLTVAISALAGLFSLSSFALPQVVLWDIGDSRTGYERKGDYVYIRQFKPLTGVYEIERGMRITSEIRLPTESFLEILKARLTTMSTSEMHYNLRMLLTNYRAGLPNGAANKRNTQEFVTLLDHLNLSVGEEGDSPHSGALPALTKGDEDGLKPTASMKAQIQRHHQ